nr:Phage-related minor tail protein [uncultured Mediterranean phage uvMED]
MANKKIKFELTAVNKTKAAFSKITKQLGSIKNVAKAGATALLGIAVAAGAVVIALAAVVKKTFAFVDAIGKTSTRTGIATDTLQAFALAALESGTSVEGGNKALEKFARSIGDAQRGLKTTKDIFKSLGVELTTNEGRYKSTTVLLEETAIGISQLGSQTEKATALANLFGRQGILLTGALEDLAERGMDGFIDRAEELGLVLSDNSIKAVEAFNDNLEVIGRQLNTIKAQILIGFLPVFEQLRVTIANKIGAVKEEFGGFDALAVTVVNNTIEALASFSEAFGEFGNKTGIVIDGIRLALTMLEQGFLAVGTAFILPFKPFFDEAEAIFENLKQRIKANTTTTLDLINKERTLDETTSKLASTMRGFKIELADLTNLQGNYNHELEEFADTGFDAMNVLTAFKNKLTGTDSVSNALDQVAVNSMKKFEDSIIDGLKNGKLAFKDFADYVIEQLLRVAIQQMVVAQIVDPFRKFLGGFNLFSGSSSSGGGTGGGVLPSNEGGGFTGFGARAGGIDGKGGFPAILHPNETVIDHTKGQGMGATVNFNISTVDAAGFDQLLASRKGLITSIINNAMNNQGKMGVV